ALHEDNVFDKRINDLDENLKNSLNKRYSDMSLNPSSISFMDRIVADSRLVALNHTAGLSTPQQVQMAFFSAFALIDSKNSYKSLNMSICHKRQEILYNALGIKLKDDKNNAAYYTQFDIQQWAYSNYGSDFVKYIKSTYTPVDILYKLARDYSIVLLSGSGFTCPEWSVRVSLANLNDDAYSTIGKA
ncbi:MAG: aspartate 4-decarboxylase, partial [Erysipelotrichales bacterium]